MNTNPISARMLIALFVAAVGAAGCSSDDPPAQSAESSDTKPAAEKPATPPADTPPTTAEGGTVSGVVGSNLTTATAEVTAVDLEKRLVTVRRPNGKTSTIRCGEGVRNLAQVKVGDQVTVAYHESLAFEVRKPGETPPGTTVTGAAARAKEGEQPAGAVGQTIQVTATIVAIDRTTMMLTLKGPDGTEIEVKARDPEKVALVSVGDVMEITYTEALAVSVTTPDAK